MLQVLQTRSVRTYATRGAHVLQTGAAQEPQAAFTAVVPVTTMVQRAIAVKVVFILVLLSVKIYG